MIKVTATTPGSHGEEEGGARRALRTPQARLWDTTFRHRAATVILKLRDPAAAKRAWLDQTAERFRQGVQLGLDAALGMATSSRAKIHTASYASIRALSLPSDYCRMAVNQAVQPARSHFGLRKSKRRTGKPTVVRSQGIGLGTNAYKVVGTALRLSTGVQGVYISKCPPLQPSVTATTRPLSE